MPGESRSRNPSGIEIVFTEADHKYASIINGKEVVYTSGTTLVSEYFKKFDAEKFAPLTAKKLNMTTEAVKEMWKKKGEDASRFGTRCHEFCEDILLGREPRNTPENVREESTFKFTKPFVEAVARKYKVVSPEMVVFDTRTRIAGTIDLFARSRTQPDLYFIFDWKTNEKLDRDNKYGDTGLWPIHHFPDSPYHHYTLQLNLYEYILKYGGYIPRNSIVKKALFWIGPRKPEAIVIEDAQLEVRDILIDFLSKRDSNIGN